MSPGMQEMLDQMHELSGSAKPDIMAKLFSPRKIVTSYVSPPIPYRQNDWFAHYDGEEEAGNYGWGATEEEAIRDFIENCKEDHDERLGGAA